MSEKFKDRGQEENLSQPAEISAEALLAIEETLKREIEQRTPRIPERERKLESITNQSGKQVGLIDRVRQPEQRDVGGQDVWLIVDFDDVVNRTTTFNADLFEGLSKISNRTEKEIGEIYEDSKLANEAGKKIFRFNEFIERIKKESPDAEAIDSVVQDFDYNKYIDSAVKRALMASHLAGFKRTRTARISILTYGDPEYQKMRIDKTNIADVADDIIYTEGSKRGIVSALLEEYRRHEYPYSGDIAAPFVITLDDSPENVDDYEGLPLQRRYANIRFHHPQAKRFAKKHTAEKAIMSEESSPNQAAVNIYKASMIATSQQAQEDRDRVFRILNKPESYDDFLEQWGPTDNHQVDFEQFIRQAR